MFKQLEQFKISILILFIIELIAIILSYMYLNDYLYIILFILLIVSGVFLVLSYFIYHQQFKNRTLSIQKVLGKEAADGFLYGGVGLVAFNENFEITWMNEVFSDDQLQYIGEKLVMWLPPLEAIIRNLQDTIRVKVEDKIFDVMRHESGQMLFFKDVTELSKATIAYQDNKIVLGLIHFDNYEEETQYEDEQKIATIDFQLRQPVVNWAKEQGIYLRRLRADRFLLVLNEKIYNRLLKDGFSILSYIRRTSNKYDFSITLSMAFALGTEDLTRLEEISNKTLELAQGRGGDQVAVKKEGEDIRYYGGGSEAQEKGSKVRVRVLAQTLRELILGSSDVIVVGHKVMDFDCFGAAIGISRIATNYNKQVAIVTDSGGVEEKLGAAMELYSDDLRSLHQMISEEEALDKLKPTTLVIMVDHHSKSQTNSPKVIEKARKIAIVDHHRRTGDFEFNPIYAYIETSSSSTTEMVTELFTYQSHQVELSDIEATIMLAGVLVDTNRFTQRTGSRTFDAAANLRAQGADPTEADNLLKDEFDEFELKTDVLNKAQRHGAYIIAPYTEQILSRTMISKVANELLKISGIEASFVISPLTDDRVGISARSKGNVNVQVIMEALGGGGHFSMAAVQKENTSVDQMHQDLVDAIETREAQEV